MGVGTQKIEGRFDVRNVTKPIVAAGQVKKTKEERGKKKGKGEKGKKGKEGK